MYKSQHSYLLYIALSLSIVSCSSVPVDSGQIDKAVNATEPKKPTRVPSSNESIVQKPLSSEFFQKPIKQVADKKVDNNERKSGYITTANIAKVTTIQQDKKTAQSKNNKKVGLIDHSTVNPKKKPPVNKATAGNTSNNKPISKKAIAKNVSPKKLKKNANLPAKKDTVAQPSKDNVANKPIVNTELAQNITDKPYVPKVPTESEEAVFKEDVREKSSILVSIEVSSSANASNDKKTSRKDLTATNDESNIVDEKIAGEEEVLPIESNTKETLDDFFVKNEEQSKNIISRNVIEDEVSHNISKKSALLTIKDDALDNFAKEQSFKSEVFDIVKQANDIISDVNKKSITDSLLDNIQQFLLFDWRLFVPSKAQYSDYKFSHCLKILDQMRNGQYEVQPPFKIDALDTHDWEQRLNGITFVQVSNIELELYTINENGTVFNAVSTVFDTDEVLSTLLPGSKGYDDQFFGLFAYSDVDEQSVGGAGRFYSINKIKNLQVYLIKWDSQYYSLSIERSHHHKIMEVIPLLSSQQQQQRNCRWRS